MNEFFFDETADESPNISHKKKTKENNIIFHKNVPFKNGVIIVMTHPTSIILYKYVSVKVLAGTISINGYEMSRSTKEPVKVFSSEKTGLVELKSEIYENIWRKPVIPREISLILIDLFGSEDTANIILRNFSTSVVAVLIERAALPSNLEFAEYYFPQVFDFNMFKRKGNKDTLWFDKKEMMSLHFAEDGRELAAEIGTLMRSAILTDSPFPKILIYGPRNTGKSTLLNNLVNRILSECREVYYLDTDLGQPEFTPPGVVSLTQLTKPIIGPPFCHQKTDKMLFVGDISPSSIEMYRNSIKTLMEIYDNEYDDAPLFVNTMGWVEGTGLVCLTNILQIVKPNVLIEIVPQGGSSMFDYREYLPQDYDVSTFQITCKHNQERKTSLSPKEMRELSLISHFGSCKPKHVGSLLLSEIRPYSVSWDKIPIFLFPEGHILPSRMVEAINGSVVALCTVPETVIMESNTTEYFKTLESDPENECLAYGLVQAVDETDHLIYIISYLSENQWAKVNAIIKGNIMVPDVFILKQELYGVPLPFVNVVEKFLKREDEEEEMDTSMLSVKFSEFGDCSPAQSNQDLRMLTPLEKYRKPVNKRYNQNFSNKRKK